MAAKSVWGLFSPNGRRRVEPEILSHADREDREANLRDLARINRWFGGHRIAKGLIRETVAPGESFTLLDAGAGSGDVSRAIRQAFPSATVVSLDRYSAHVQAADGPRLAADVFRLPFPPRSFDIVFCSLLLHEYEDSEARELLRGLFETCRRALIVVDLYRHPLAYHFLPATRPIFKWHEVTLHDGPVSVAAAFRPKDLRALAVAAGLKYVRVKSHWPWFRLSLMARREANEGSQSSR